MVKRILMLFGMFLVLGFVGLGSASASPGYYENPGGLVFEKGYTIPVLLADMGIDVKLRFKPNDSAIMPLGDSEWGRVEILIIYSFEWPDDLDHTVIGKYVLPFARDHPNDPTDV